MADICTIMEAARALRAGDVTSVELVGKALSRRDLLDQRLGVYVASFAKEATEAACVADQEMAAGVDRGPLHGVPIGVKDLIETREAPTTAQSQVTRFNQKSPYDAVVVSRLREAGAIIMGKTTTHEFGLGFPDPNGPFPVPRNPWNEAMWPGGSSSGSAVGVATGMFVAALGTDSGGSIRIPSSLCGVSGLKPTYGRVPTTGLIGLSESLDHVGPIASSAWDCAALLSVLAAGDGGGRLEVEHPAVDFVVGIDTPIDGLRVGFAGGDCFDGTEDRQLVEAYESSRAVFGSLGAEVVDVAIPRYSQAMAATHVISLSEGCCLHWGDLREHWKDYLPDTRQTLSWGVLFSGADYVQAQRIRVLARAELADLFKTVDLLIAPTITRPAPSYDEVAQGGVGSALSGVHTPYWNGTGNPVLVVPIGFTGDGLPTGIQICGPLSEDARVLRAGHAFQSVTDWHVRRPPCLSGSPE
jgi:aspartyl-tRNA(Asn)/glutamyl-tRNA(Gln) amidotransferase subunit A